MFFTIFIHARVNKFLTNFLRRVVESHVFFFSRRFSQPWERKNGVCVLPARRISRFAFEIRRGGEFRKGRRREKIGPPGVHTRRTVSECFAVWDRKARERSDSPTSTHRHKKQRGSERVSSRVLCSRNSSCHAICYSYVMIVASVIPEPRLFCHWQCFARYLCSRASLLVVSFHFGRERERERRIPFKKKNNSERKRCLRGALVLVLPTR